jgi:hypothetical protein
MKTRKIYQDNNSWAQKNIYKTITRNFHKNIPLTAATISLVTMTFWNIGKKMFSKSNIFNTRTSRPTITQQLYNAAFLATATIRHRDQEANILESKTRHLYNEINKTIPDDIEKDYIPNVAMEDDKQGIVTCDLDYLLQNECDLATPLNSCKQCIGMRECTRGLNPQDSYIILVVDGKDYELPLPQDMSKGKCLPSVHNVKSCNPYVGTPVVAKVGGNYIYYCREKFPDMVRKSHIFAEPDIIVACGENDGIGILVNPLTQVPWHGERDYEPIHASCSCNLQLGYIPTNYSLITQTYQACGRDVCGDYGQSKPLAYNEPHQCLCEPGYIKCPPVHPNTLSTTEIEMLCGSANRNGHETCVLDPCRWGFENITSPRDLYMNENEGRCVTTLDDNQMGVLIKTRDKPRGVYALYNEINMCSKLNMDKVWAQQ